MGTYTFLQNEFSQSALVKGTSGFAEKENSCIKDTGVYLPPKHSFDNDTVNVILWFHGYYVQSAKDLFRPGVPKMDMKLRESILNSASDVILIGPWLGLKNSSDTGTLGLGPLGQGDGCQDYLEKVLEGIVRLQKSVSPQATSSLRIDNLILAGHSAGGALMREASKHLGKLKDNLKECWGFDCFYDDEYGQWAKENPGSKKFIYFGNGSGNGGSHAFKFMKEVYGTPKKPIPDHQGLPNVNLAPAVDRTYTANDNIAFQSIEDIQEAWNPYGPNVYRDVRKATDPFLNDNTHTTYWSKILPKLTEHFQVVRDLFGPRIKQSDAL